MTKNEIDQARSLSDSLRRDLKPVPSTLAFVDKAAAKSSAPAGAVVPAAAPKNFADELTDWGIPPQTGLKSDVGSRTPLSLPGATRVTTQDVQRIVSQALLVDVLNDTSPLHLTIPGAVHVPGGGNYGDGRLDDRLQDQFENVLAALIRRNPNKPVIFFCASARCWESYNAALRALKMGVRNILWYRGGITSWKEANLPLGVPIEVHRIK